MVRRIYREYLEGASFVKIRRGLEADGILNGAKHARWHETNIKQILTNEKYTGDALLQKTYIIDCISKKSRKNNGELPMYLVKKPSRTYNLKNRIQSSSRRNGSPKE